MSDHPTKDKIPNAPGADDNNPSDESFLEFEKEVASDEGMPPPEVQLAQQQKAADELPEEDDDEADDDIEAQLAALTQERDTYLDQWRRSTADFQNYKKREERLRGEREQMANMRLLKKLLPVLDDLQRAAQHVPEELNSNDWVNGMLSIERKLWTVLEGEGVSAIEAEPGTPFNPEVHEALMTQESDEHESDQVIQTLENGYQKENTVLRPARVIVAQ